MHDITAWMTVNRGTTFQNGTFVNHHASRTVSLNAGGMFAIKTNYTHILTSCTFSKWHLWIPPRITNSLFKCGWNVGHRSKLYTHYHKLWRCSHRSTSSGMGTVVRFLPPVELAAHWRAFMLQDLQVTSRPGCLA